MHIYEYLFAAILIALMLISSTTMITMISEPSRSTSQKEQLKITAEKIMTQILLDPGTPTDWGTNLEAEGNTLETFGLAKYSETSKEAYALDPNKVLRLDSKILPQSYYIPPSKVKNLLNFGYDYGFALELYPALIVDVTTASNIITISIVGREGLPIYPVTVTAKVYYHTESDPRIQSTIQIDKTYVNGQCTIDLNEHNVPLDANKILIVSVNYYGIHVLKVIDLSGSNIRAFLLGNDIYGAEYSDDEALEIMINKKAGSYAIESITYNPQKNIEPTTIAILAISNDGSRLVYAHQLPASEPSGDSKITYSSIQGVDLSFPLAYSTERSVMICGSAYIIRLYVWRMSF